MKKLFVFFVLFLVVFSSVNVLATVGPIENEEEPKQGIVARFIVWFFTIFTGSDNVDIAYVPIEIGEKNVRDGPRKFGAGRTKVVPDIVFARDCGLDQDCFEKRFAKCDPSVLLVDQFGVEYRYEIHKKESKGCRVKSEFVSNPNPDFVGKSMICYYDNSLPFEEVIQDMSSCKGSLATLFEG